ncbi:transposase [Streptomyces sp. NPDC001857]|uniref:transposase n=1 Tax=unclassified Streptomyces TaxID=2593676 RepID=UPI00331E92D6
MCAGCEGTVSATVHAHGLRKCRYRGLAETHVQHVLTAAGANVSAPLAVGGEPRGTGMSVNDLHDELMRHLGEPTKPGPAGWSLRQTTPATSCLGVEGGRGRVQAPGVEWTRLPVGVSRRR